MEQPSHIAIVDIMYDPCSSIINITLIGWIQTVRDSVLRAALASMNCQITPA